MYRCVVPSMAAVLLAAVLAPPPAASVAAVPSTQVLRPPFGGQRVVRHWPRSRRYDLVHVKVDLALDLEARGLSGRASLSLEPLADGLERVELDAAELEVIRVARKGGGELEHDRDGQRLGIRLDRPHERGERLTLDVDYRARPRKGLYFRETGPSGSIQVWSQGESEDTRYWIPLYDYPNDKTTTELIVTVPEDMTVVSNGRLVAESRDPATATRTFHWLQDRPHSTYLVSLVAGHFDRHGTEMGNVAVGYYVPPGTDPATVARSFGATPDMLRFFADYLGVAYPWAKYAQVTVEDFLWGGMENTSASTLTRDTLHDPSAEPNFTSEGLVAHEVAHQWWGDLVTCRDWSEIWIHEGFASMFTHLWFEHRYGRDRYDYRRYESLEEYLEEVEDEYRRPVVWPVYVDEMDLFDDHSYDKGSLVLAMIRDHLGDEAFRRAMRRFVERHAEDNVTTADLRRAISEATGQELDWLIEPWLFGAGHPEFRVSSAWSAVERVLTLVVEQTQALDELTPVFRIPVDVEIRTTEGATRRRVSLERARAEFHFRLPERPRWVRFDPEHVIPKTLEFPKSTEELIDLLRHDPSVIGRIWAGEQLAERIESPAAEAALREAVTGDPFPGVRVEVASLLDETRTREARDILIEALEDADARVREQAAESLGRFREDGRVARALLELVEKDPKVYVVAAALKALGRVRSERSYAALVAALERDSHKDVIRSKALEGLGKLGDARAVPLLLAWSRPGRSRHAREAAVEALADLGEGRPEVVEHVGSLLADDRMNVRREAAKTLGDLGGAKALEALRAAAGREVERRVLREIEASIDSIRRDEDSVEKLRRRVRELEREVRRLRRAPP